MMRILKFAILPISGIILMWIMFYVAFYEVEDVYCTDGIVESQSTIDKDGHVIIMKTYRIDVAGPTPRDWLLDRYYGNDILFNSVRWFTYPLMIIDCKVREYLIYLRQ